MYLMSLEIIIETVFLSIDLSMLAVPDVAIESASSIRSQRRVACLPSAAQAAITMR